MLINFQRVFSRETTMGDFAAQFDNAALGEALNNYIDFTIQIVNSVSDEQAVHIPHDPDADDVHAATEEERHAGWSLAHLVMHITASAEEAAAFSSILARGITLGGRLRHERDWREVKTCAEVLARLEECRRICLSYLATWPDQPDLTALRIMPDDKSWMKPNAPISFLGGLMHWHAHVEQLKKVAEPIQPVTA